MTDRKESNIRYIASCSFGKDSIAAIITRLQRGEPVDEIVYARIMYADEISAEYPEHEKWIHAVAIPKLEKDWKARTTIVQSEKTYLDIFHSIKQKGKYKGAIYGFPMMMKSWCNDRLKVKPIRKYYKTLADPIKQIIGIAFDEPKRAMGKGIKDAILPLVDYKITEAGAFEICQKYGLLSPAYNSNVRRLGCWFCHKAGLKDLRYIRDNYPQFWRHLLEIDAESPNVFRMTHTVTELEKRFSLEDRQMKLNFKEGKT